MTPLSSKLHEDPYQGYAYGYPHKTAYTPLSPATPLKPHWDQEDLKSLYFYLHLPFCEMRCGFCNLFTTTHPDDGLVSAYLATVKRQMQVMADMLEAPHFSQAAFGGGTPSFLALPELEKLFTNIDQTLGPFAPGIPISFETSPATVDQEKLSFLRERGVTRLSIGIQSFVIDETKALGRPQKEDVLHSALTLIAETNFPVFNIDLIYGVQGQTPDSWQISLDKAVSYRPQELYLYPLYVRPLTGLGKREKHPSDSRLELYTQARDFLISQGYEQISMRLFRHCDAPVPKGEGPIHCCQEDGMVGLGAGSRSYTSNLHYSSEYAVGRSGIMEILKHYVASSDDDFRHADYGYQLQGDDHQRRFLIKSLLRRGGLDLAHYQREFQQDARTDFASQIRQLIECAFAKDHGDSLELTAKGFAYSDMIGPWLFSDEILEKMEAYELV